LELSLNLLGLTNDLKLSSPKDQIINLHKSVVLRPLDSRTIPKEEKQFQPAKKKKKID